MKHPEEIKEIAISTITDEAEAVKGLIDSINDDFVKVVELIYSSPGRVIATGIGKSAIIASKIVATLNSTGTPAIFMHAADAVHGDLGTIRKDDIIICLSKSGNTPEIKVLAPLLKLAGNTLIAMVGNTDSYLAKQADYILDVSVKAEACANNLAPTSSTTVQLVMGDALAVAVLECRGFTISDFARYHPGGVLGKQLYLRVQDIYINNEVPKVQSHDNVRAVIVEITTKRLGATAVLENNTLCGIITDGDIRRMLHRNAPIDQLTASDIMSVQPKTIESDALVSDALNLMRQSNITQLLVLNKGVYAGVIHLHDILKEGII
ncbi:MAG: KpsF/GutQ family sugar-phosphate isomerase [Bacteroidales bacterium]|nr:KpsF/GutQ family sugar-phosphate isomerase [Bacteroidales bacterium]MDZ4204561.1 KpsF/GutQ family sugar-phosphate isomerase [Bacteroidales bacterium]